ncbi:sulfite exporter TauE/SafE family protein [Devosia algicola]|uniref:Probable membrane transporter protein n=1 Tax=Devosia algicola TaxID=3026418 RepID=A0ABY7YSA5_9HYPH|nr:sulfite exporter TauE/SafE family protein [Devosia algicola]WDR04003.1 sulfite exporter TauE/SafE family protein [Devosia algicola]
MALFGFIDPLFTLSGLIVGAIVGLTGVGGGSLMTPLLILLFGVHPATAVGTDLLYAAATKSAGTLAHGFNQVIDWRIVGLLASGSVPAAIVTVSILSNTGIQSDDVSRVISIALGVMLLLTALSMFFRPQLVKLAASRPDMGKKRQVVLTITTGLIIGVMVSISSVGAGAGGVVALMLLYPKMPTVRIIGSDIAHAVPLTLVAGMGHWAIGSIDGHMLISLLIGSIPGVLITSHFAPRVNETLLRTLLGCVLILVGTRLLFS